MNRVEVVLCNYRRPKNIPPIISAFRGQTVIPKITIVNCPYSPAEELDASALEGADEVYTCRVQRGGWMRFTPFWNFDHEFTYFHDDDMLPGTRVIEHWLTWADRIKDFGVLGQKARITYGYKYRWVEVPREAVPKRVDVLVEGYFAKTELLPLMLPHRRSIMAKGGARGCDILLCTALSHAGHHTYLTPTSPDPEEKMEKAPLSKRYALSDHPDHYNIRQGLIDQMRQFGWRSCSDRSDTLSQ
jgi:hypothetical protein